MRDRLFMWIFRRFGFRGWYLASMWYEVLRALCNYRPVTWVVIWGEPRLLTFGVRWNRRRWGLDLVPLPEEAEE